MERFGRLATGENHMSVSVAPDSQSAFSVECIIFSGGRESPVTRMAVGLHRGPTCAGAQQGAWHRGRAHQRELGITVMDITNR